MCLSLVQALYFVYWSIQLILKPEASFFVVGHTTRHVGSYFPDQRSNPCLLYLKYEVFNHWTAKEVPIPS